MKEPNPWTPLIYGPILLFALILLTELVSRADTCGSVQVCDSDGICELKHQCWQDQRSNLENHPVRPNQHCYEHQASDGSTVLICQ